MIHAQLKRLRVILLKEKPLGMDLTVPRKNPSNNDYYTPINCSGWNQQVRNVQVVLIRCGNQGLCWLLIHPPSSLELEM
jgi:hypothetical protein